jgi:Ser/Thr protein kinase RdoA (MazF antagonist)
MLNSLTNDVFRVSNGSGDNILIKIYRRDLLEFADTSL